MEKNKIGKQETKTAENHNSESGRGLSRFRPDVIVTPKNYESAFKRITLCIKERKVVRIGMTLKNEIIYKELIKELKLLDIRVKEIERVPYRVQEHEAVCVTISLQIPKK